MQPLSSTTVSIQRDTRAWQFQTWASFAIAVFLCATGLSWLPGQALDRAFMVMGYVFCLSTAFMLAKFIRDGEQAAAGLSTGRDVPMWRMVVWGSFFTAMALTGWGLVRMEINDTYKAFLGVSWLFLISSAFTLAKTLRDRHEADMAEARLQGRRLARAEAAAKSIAAVLVAACTALAGVSASFQAQAQSDASTAISLMPVASVLVTASAVGASADSVGGVVKASAVLPAALSVAGSMLTVVAVEASADGTVYVLERASDGARASIRVAGRAANCVSAAVGTGVTVSVIGSGVVLSAAGEVLAFVPNAIGRALLYNERLS